MASTLQRLRRTCDRIEQRVRHKRLATDDDLADYRPGGRENPEKRGLWPWIRWYGILMQHLYTDEQRNVAPDGEQTSEEAWRRADEEIMRAMSSTPTRIKLLTPVIDDDDTKVDFVSVYPKSYEALIAMHQRHLCVTWLVMRVAILLDTDAEGMELAQRALDEIVFHNQVAAWIACHRGPRMPYDEWPPTLPRMWRDIDVKDLERIQQVHVLVNAHRLTSLDKFVRPPDEDDHRLSWSVFGGVMAERMKRPANELFRDMALSELIATAATMNVPHQKAADELERQRKETQRATAG